MKNQPPDFTILTLAAVIASASAAVILVVLTHLSQPADAAPRIEALEQQQIKLVSLTQRGENPSVYSAKAVCNDPVERLDETLRQSISNDAKAAGVDLSGLELSPGAEISGSTSLTPVAVRLNANGRYDGVLALISLLGRSQPELFIDAVDLRSKVSTVDLKLSGRVFCSTSARL